MAKVQDLIAKCDESEIFAQNLDDNFVNAEVKNKNGYVTFLTDPQIIYDRFTDNAPKVGIVIWFPNDIFER